jgi:hypothetical protein
MPKYNEGDEEMTRRTVLQQVLLMTKLINFEKNEL